MIQFDAVICIKLCCVVLKYIWLTENMSNSLTRKGADEGAEEGPNEGVGEEGHVMERVGGVQQTRSFRE